MLPHDHHYGLEALMHHRASRGLSPLFILALACGCTKKSSAPQPSARPATSATTSQMKGEPSETTGQPGGARQQEFTGGKATQEIPRFEDLPAPSKEVMRDLTNKVQRAAEVIAYSNNSDIPPALLDISRGSSNARTETDEGTLSLGPTEYESPLIGEDFYKANVRWENQRGDVAWERKFRLAPGCGGRWNLSAIIGRERVYLWTIRTRDAYRYVANVPIPSGPGPCKVTFVLTMLDKRTGETLDGARIEGIHTPDKVALVDPGLLAIHEKWVYYPGNHCEDGPCRQDIERARFFDAKTLERTHYFEELGPHE